jgi:hypothetical protein
MKVVEFLDGFHDILFYYVLTLLEEYPGESIGAGAGRGGGLYRKAFSLLRFGTFYIVEGSLMPFKLTSPRFILSQSKSRFVVGPLPI